MEIATAILPVILEPQIKRLLKQILETSRSIDSYEHDLHSLSYRVSVLKRLLGQVLDRLYSSTGLSLILPEPVIQWLQRWFDLIEEAETTIAECNNDNQTSTYCMPSLANVKRIKQTMKKIKEMHDDAQTFLMTCFLHMLTCGQIGFQTAGNGLPYRASQMAVICPIPQVMARLQGTASRLTVGPSVLSGQLLRGDIDTYATDFALVMGHCNPPISVIVNSEEGVGDPRLIYLTQIVDDAEEMAIQSCQEQILITTNVKRILEIEALSDEERWEVFQFHVKQDCYMYSNDMEEISRAIFRCIATRPYLIEGVAHILARLNNQFYWQLKLALFTTPSEHLYDRYSALPFYIKLCFLSCAAFPRDEGIDVENLVELWIAEGLMPIKHELIDLVAFGYQVVKLLLRYRLIEVSGYDWAGRPVHCMLPDRIHYMAVQIVNHDERCFFRPCLDLDVFSWPKNPLCRSISLISNKIKFLPKRSAPTTVRSLLLRGNIGLKHVPHHFLTGLTSLRVLDLSNTGIVSLPSSLGHLKLLVHLQLSSTQIETLPESIKHLKKLQSLLLSSCSRLLFLPTEISQLQSLKHLDVSGCTSLKSLPYGITKLAALQILKTNGTHVWKTRSGYLQNMGWLFSIGKSRRIACLNDLKALRNMKRLHLDSDEDSVIPDEVIGNMREIQSLWLGMTKLESLPEDMTAVTGLGELQLWKCMRLQELPDWVCEFYGLRFLRLNHCYSLISLPFLQTLPLLRVLEIEFCESLMELPSEFGRDGAFPALQSFALTGLKIRLLPRIERGAMPKVKRLALKSCKNLKELPIGIENMEYLETLEITDSDLLLRSISSHPIYLSGIITIVS